MEDSRPTVLVADDHQMFLDGLRGLLEPHCVILDEAHDGETMIRKATQLQPDVIVTDISMPGVSGLQALRRLADNDVTAKVILLTMHAEPEYAAEAISLGASGYVLKHSASSELLTAIEEAVNGGAYISPVLVHDVVQMSARRSDKEVSVAMSLSERHRDILRLLANGLAAKEIASQLKISPRTVEYHKYTLIEKLGLNSTAELIAFAVREGIAEQ